MPCEICGDRVETVKDEFEGDSDVRKSLNLTPEEWDDGYLAIFNEEGKEGRICGTHALEILDPGSEYAFCNETDCEKVAIYQIKTVIDQYSDTLDSGEPTINEIQPVLCDEHFDSD